MRRILVLTAALSAAASSGAQVPLSVDTLFRMNLHARNVNSMAFLASGQLLLSGRMEFTGETTPRYLARIFPNGQNDQSFPYSEGGSKLTAWNDRFYVQGSQTVRRLLPNGQIDPSFHHMNSDPYFLSLQGGDYHVYPDGRVLMGGYHTIDAPHLGYQGAYNLIWFYNNGRLDTTRAHRTGNGAVFGIREYPAGTAGGLGGKFLVHHWGTEYEGQPVSKVIRVHADGSLDESFNAPIPWGYVYDMLPLPDGRAYIAGEFHLENGTDRIQLVRLLPDGSLDASFNNGLAFEIDTAHLATSPSVMDVFDLGAGLLALAGDFNSVDGHARGGLCIIDTTGQVVPFYADGAGCGNYEYQMGLQTVTYGALSGITRAPNGQYYIWGAYHGYSDGTTNDTLQRMVTRLHGGEIGLGVRPTSQRTPGMRLYPVPASTHLTLEMEEVARDVELVLSDALGREVMRQSFAAHSTTVSIAHLGTGLYHAELLRHGERTLTQRLLVAR
jgi:uncharacterized delta-60 repeat protein